MFTCSVSTVIAKQKEHSGLLWREFWGVLFMAVFWFALSPVHRVQLKLASGENTLLFLRAKFPNFHTQPVSSRPTAPASASSGLPEKQHHPFLLLSPSRPPPPLAWPLSHSQWRGTYINSLSLGIWSWTDLGSNFRSSIL